MCETANAVCSYAHILQSALDACFTYAESIEPTRCYWACYSSLLSKCDCRNEGRSIIAGNVMQCEAEPSKKIVLSTLCIRSVAEGEHGTIIVAPMFGTRRVHIVRQSVDEVQAMLAEARRTRGLFSGSLTFDLVDAEGID